MPKIFGPKYMECGFSVLIAFSHKSYRVTILNTLAADRCRSVDHLVPGSTSSAFLLTKSITITELSNIAKTYTASSFPVGMDSLRHCFHVHFPGPGSNFK